MNDELCENIHRSKNIEKYLVDKDYYCITCKKRAEKPHSHNICDHCIGAQEKVNYRHIKNSDADYTNNLIRNAEVLEFDGEKLIQNENLYKVCAGKYKQRKYYKKNGKNFCENEECNFSYKINSGKLNVLDDVITCKFCLLRDIYLYENKILNHPFYEDYRWSKYGGPE